MTSRPTTVEGHVEAVKNAHAQALTPSSRGWCPPVSATALPRLLDVKQLAAELVLACGVAVRGVPSFASRVVTPCCRSLAPGRKAEA